MLDKNFFRVALVFAAVTLAFSVYTTALANNNKYCNSIRNSDTRNYCFGRCSQIRNSDLRNFCYGRCDSVRNNDMKYLCRARKVMVK